MLDKFKEIMKKLDPSGTVLTEQVQNDLISDLTKKLEVIKESAKEEAMTKAVVQANAKIKQLDTDHTKKLETFVEEVKTKYNTKLQRIDENHSRKLERLVKIMDAVSAKKLKTLFEKVDETYTAKMKTLVEKIDEVHTSKLKLLAEKMSDKKVVEPILEKVNSYVDTYVKEHLPEKQIINEEKLNRLEKCYTQLREILMVNDEYVQKEIKEAISDAKTQIESKDGVIDKLMFEKIELTKKLENIEAKHLLSEKIKDMTPSMKSYIGTRFENATKKEIEEQLNEAVEAFRLEEKNKRSKIVAEADSKKKIKSPVIEESISQLKTEDQVDPSLSEYIKVLSKQK